MPRQVKLAAHVCAGVVVCVVLHTADEIEREGKQKIKAGEAFGQRAGGG